MSNRGLSLKDRILANCNKVDSGCWEWNLLCQRYGIIRVAGKTMKAHRASWEAHHGMIPDGMCVCHKCDNPKCVNPEHLFLGTQTDNVRDCVSKGRYRQPPKCSLDKRPLGDRNGMRTHPGVLAGEKNGRSKVSDVQRAEIVGLKQSGYSASQIAAEFHLTASSVNRIVREYGRRILATRNPREPR